jgi:hypothetical protein
MQLIALVVLGVPSWLIFCVCLAAVSRTRRFAAYAFIPPVCAAISLMLAALIEKRFYFDHRVLEPQRSGLIGIPLLILTLACSSPGFILGAKLAAAMNERLGLPHNFYPDDGRRQWWEGRRRFYNAAMAASGWLAYFIALGMLYLRHSGPDNAIDAVVMTLGLGAIYFALMQAANVCFFLGPALEDFVRPHNLDGYRRLSFRAGLAFSCIAPTALFLLICAATNLK